MNATPATLNLALSDLAARAEGEVDNLRTKKHIEQRDGRRHALYMILAYNASRSMR